MACNNRPHMRRLASFVRSQRILRGWAQVDLAAAADVSKRTIQRIESVEDDVRMTSISAVADAFGITLSEFFREVEGQ